MQFADQRKERQKKIEQDAKNDAQDKQEVEKRRKLHLLMLYNQFLRTRMDEQLKRYEELEDNYEKIRNICGTQDLEFIIDFIMLRNKRYNYAVQIVDEKEQRIKKLRKEIKELNQDLVKLKNNNIVNEKGQDSRTETTVENSGMEEEEIEMIKKENEKNQHLLVLGKKYNEINLAYNKVLENIQAMKEYDQAHPLGIKEEDLTEKKEEKQEEKKEEKQEEKKESKIKLTKEEEEWITEYEKFLKKILRAFNILYICKSKQEFMTLMREKGINSQNEKSTLNKSHRIKGKRTTKRLIKNDKSNLKTDAENNKNDEEEDISTHDPDRKILTRFIREQKKEIDEFINVKKQTNTKQPTTAAK
jgi:hypothetical protein